ncbi:proline dehydrogenase family protein [Pseudonocardia charpentierae]|uniref:proline dehydrogenase n=1 Tax=Pseudonocardia charpentierae TaxID=3075545 RepID=A0ABU2NBM9_9PSEU|nr:proline dehydrogenase family protein [Pseudonocardia sp. DSM 45834]MDT0350893.1 proline dehydrogenase family protein [Pseudonocardia sp. DSM 45834]
MLRSMLLAAGKSPRMRAFAEGARPMRPVVDRFVAGNDLDAALPVIAGLAADRLVTVDHLGENATDRAGVDATVDAYRALLLRLTAEGLAERVEVSVKLSAVGQGLPDGDALSLAGARAICEAAAEAGTTVTVDMEDHTTTDATLATVAALRADFPWVAAVLQSQLRRTEGDCRDLAGPGSRVRLCKGAYDEPESVAFAGRADVDRSYVRCMKILFAGEGLPLVATHDPRLVAIAQHLGRDRPYELQMLYGVRPGAQVDLAAAGERMRVYVPYGTQWYGYFMRRLAERPANVAFFLRALATRG